MTTNISLINRRQDVRGIARLLLCPFRLEPDINQCYEKPRRVMTMKKFLAKHHPTLRKDVVSDDCSWFLLVTKKENK